MSELEALVEFVVGEGVTVSLVALPEGIQVGASAAIRGEVGGVEATIIPWRRIAQMRRVAKALKGKRGQ